MTQNQLRFQELYETQRSNRVKEAETKRSNMASERIQRTSNAIKAVDTVASNLINLRNANTKRKELRLQRVKTGLEAAATVTKLLMGGKGSKK